MWRHRFRSVCYLFCLLYWNHISWNSREFFCPVITYHSARSVFSRSRMSYLLEILYRRDVDFFHIEAPNPVLKKIILYSLTQRRKTFETGKEKVNLIELYPAFKGVCSDYVTVWTPAQVGLRLKLYLKPRILFGFGDSFIHGRICLGHLPQE